MKYNKLNNIFLYMLQTAFILCIIFSFNCKKNDPWIWDIEGEKFTKKQIEDAYEGYLFWWALQFNTTPDKLKEQLADIDSVEDPRQKELLHQLKKETFLLGEEGSASPLIKKLLVINIEAKKSDFLKREEIQKKLNFMNQFFIYNLYMMDNVKPDSIQISDSEALAKFEELRKSNPQYLSIPIVKGQEMTKQQLFMQTVMSKQEKLVNNLLESYAIKSNSEFKIEKLLENTKKETNKK